MILLWMLGMYLGLGLFFYLYAVIKSFEYSGIWNWEITDTHVSVAVYPQWLLGWVYWTKKKITEKFKK